MRIARLRFEGAPPFEPLRWPPARPLAPARGVRPNLRSVPTAFPSLP